MKHIFYDIMREVESAKEKYPEFPDDLIHCIAILSEECGESVRATLNHVYHNDDIEEVKKELIQTGAMVIR